MSNFPRFFPLGAPFNGELPSACIESFDVALTKCPNFTEGSDHSASNPVILRNKGMQFASTLHVEPYITKATLQTAATLECATGSFVNFKGTCEVHFKDTASITCEAGTVATCEAGSTLNLKGSVAQVVGSTASLAGGNTLEGSGTLLMKAGSDTAFEFGANLTLSNNVTHAGGTWTQSAKVFRSGAGGRTCIRRLTLTPDTTQNVSVANDHYRYEHTIAGARSLTALKTGTVPQDGEVIAITVINTSPANAGVVTILSEGSATPIVSSAYSFTVELIFDSNLNRWALKSFGDAGAHGTIGGNA